MAYDVFGAFTRLYNFVADRNAAIKIRADRMDGELDGMATAFNQVVLRSGVAPMTGNLQMGQKSITGLEGANGGTGGGLSFFGDATTGLFQDTAGSIKLRSTAVDILTISNQAVSVTPAPLTGAGTPSAGIGYAQTWNNINGNYTGLAISITNTNCRPAGSRLFKASVSGQTKFDIDINGALLIAGTQLDMSTGATLTVFPSNHAALPFQPAYAMVVVIDTVGGSTSLWLLASNTATLVAATGQWVASTTAPAANAVSMAFAGGTYNLYAGSAMNPIFRMGIFKFG